MLKVFLYIKMQSPRWHCWCQLVMLLIIKGLKDEALMVLKDSDISVRQNAAQTSLDFY